MPHIASICRILFALVLSLLLHACSRGDKPAEPVTVSAPTVRATLYDARECRSLPGEVRSRNSVTLASKISGTVVEVLAVEGAVVEKGQVILRIDDSEIKQRVQAVQSSAQQAGLERQALAARRDMAKTNLERMQKLFAQQVISRDELDRAATEYQALRKQEQALAASAASAGHQGAEAQSLMGYSVVTAPFRGVLSRRFVDQGAFVNAGAPLAAIDDVQSGYELEAQADESLMAQVTIHAGAGTPSFFSPAPYLPLLSAVVWLVDPATRTYKDKAAMRRRPKPARRPTPPTRHSRLPPPNPTRACSARSAYRSPARRSCSSPQQPCVSAGSWPRCWPWTRRECCACGW